MALYGAVTWSVWQRIAAEWCCQLYVCFAACYGMVWCGFTICYSMVLWYGKMILFGFCCATTMLPRYERSVVLDKMVVVYHLMVDC